MRRMYDSLIRVKLYFGIMRIISDTYYGAYYVDGLFDYLLISIFGIIR